MLKKIFHFVGADLKAARHIDVEHNSIHYLMYLIHNFTVWLCFIWILGLLADINLQNSAFAEFFYGVVFPGPFDNQFVQDNQMKAIFWLFLPVSIFISFAGAIYFFTPHFQKQCQQKEMTSKIGKNIFFAVLYFIGGILFSLVFLWGGYITLFGIITALGPQQHWLIITLQTLVMPKFYGLIPSTIFEAFIRFFLFFRHPAPKT